MDFPDYFPDYCPPDDAVDGPMLLYRFVFGNPVADADFRTNYEKGTQKDQDFCMRCGISTFDKPERAKEFSERVPAFRKAHLAKGLVPEDAGKIKKTEERAPGHHTWWPYSDVDRKSYFVISDI